MINFGPIQRGDAGIPLALALGKAEQAAQRFAGHQDDIAEAIRAQIAQPGQHRSRVGGVENAHQRIAQRDRALIVEQLGQFFQLARFGQSDGAAFERT